MHVRPLHDRVLLKRLEEKEVKKGGIIIPDTAKEKPQQGKVIAVGNGKVKDDGTRIPLDVKKGDRIAQGLFIPVTQARWVEAEEIRAESRGGFHSGHCRLGGERMIQIGREEPRAEGSQELAIQPASVLEADLELRRMDVHIDQFGRHLHRQKRDRLTTDHQQSAIGLAQGVLQRPIADVPAVEEKILHPVVAAALAGVGDVAREPHRPVRAAPPACGAP